MNATVADPPEDWEAVRRAAQGDSSAFKPLFDKYAPQLFAFLASRLGQSEAEDALQTVMLNAWQAITHQKYQESHFRGWIFEIARHVFLDRVRRKNKPENFDHHAGAIADRKSAPDFVFELKHRHHSLRDCLESLKRDEPEWATVVLRKFIDESDHKTIAADLGIAEGTSHSRLHRALKRLKECMESKGVSE